MAFLAPMVCAAVKPATLAQRANTEKLSKSAKCLLRGCVSADS
jgi:hypothetical protein